jgi:lipoprotein-anchoring transpeptidase ErfK/SrfK
MRTVEGVKYYRTRDKRWLHQLDVGLAVAPASWPEDAEKGKKWIEISISNQTLVMWEGKRPIYATLVSTGQAGLDDPKKTTATVRGVFKIRNKHITATMDSNESSSVGGRANTTALASAPVSTPDEDSRGRDRGGERAVARSAGASGGNTGGGGGNTSSGGGNTGSKDRAKAKSAAKGDKGGSKGGPKASAPKSGGKTASGSTKPAPGGKASGDSKSSAGKGAKDAAAAGHHAPIPKKGDGVYGVTKRRGEGTFQLRDVPYIQYFESGYALHAAYWHDVFGTPRSHGCVNLSPVDAHRLFLWTDPPVPEGWHAVNAGEEMGEGTTVIVHE